MADTLSHARTEVEYRFNYTVSPQTCPLCGTTFEPRIGSWPFLPGTNTPVCGGERCPIGEDVAGPSPCDTMFEFVELRPQTLKAIAAAEVEGESVAERLRRVALDESLPDPDRAVLQLAAIDLQFCEADGSRIRRIEPGLIVQTCAEAAAEMLLSGCGDIVD
ncbi:MAG TPA: hypothetical protein VFZ69_09535 [Longimicrobiales bacterium]